MRSQASSAGGFLVCEVSNAQVALPAAEPNRYTGLVQRTPVLHCAVPYHQPPAGSSLSPLWCSACASPWPGLHHLPNLSAWPMYRLSLMTAQRMLGNLALRCSAPQFRARLDLRRQLPEQFGNSAFSREGPSACHLYSLGYPMYRRWGLLAVQSAVHNKSLNRSHQRRLARRGFSEARVNWTGSFPAVPRGGPRIAVK